jgi:hypothetical protein
MSPAAGSGAGAQRAAVAPNARTSHRCIVQAAQPQAPSLSGDDSHLCRGAACPRLPALGWLIRRRALCARQVLCFGINTAFLTDLFVRCALIRCRAHRYEGARSRRSSTTTTRRRCWSRAASTRRAPLSRLRASACAFSPAPAPALLLSLSAPVARFLPLPRAVAR